MMSEYQVPVSKTVDVMIGWQDVFGCAQALLQSTRAIDVRWVHVERAQALLDGLKEKHTEGNAQRYAKVP